MGTGFAPAWLRQVSPPPLLRMTTLTTDTGVAAECDIPHHGVEDAVQFWCAII